MDINKKFELLTEAPGQVKTPSKPSHTMASGHSTAQSKAGIEAKRLGLVHLGYGYYGKAEGQPPSHKSEDGKLRKLTSAEAAAHAKNLAGATAAQDPNQPSNTNKPPAFGAPKLDQNLPQFPGDGRGGIPPMQQPPANAIGPEDFEDEPDVVKQAGQKIKPVIPGKPTRERRTGSVTPGGDDKVKNTVLKKGMSKSGVAAPGNAGSAMNEILTGEALHRLLEQPAYANDELSLTLQLYKEYRHTELAKENTTGDEFKKARDPRLQGINKELFAKLLATSRAGMGEARRLTMGLKNVGWTLKDTEVHHFYGATYSKEMMTEMLEKAKEKKRRIIAPSGAEIPFEEAMNFVKKSGARENPSDTAVVARNKTGDLMLAFTSNKLTVGDIQANSSPMKELEESKNIIEHTNVGLDLDTIQKAHEIVNKTIRDITEIQSELGNTVAPTAKYFMQGKGASQIKDLIKAMSSPGKGKGLKSDPNRVKRYQALVQGRFTLDRLNKKLSTGVLTKESAFLQTAMKRANPEWHGGEPTPVQKMRAFLTVMVDGKGTGDDMKLLSRASLDIHGVPSPAAAVATLRMKVMSSEDAMTRKLDKFTTKNGVPLGTHVAATKLSAKLHLDPAFEGQKHGIFAHDGLFEVNMGGTMVGKKQLQHCLDVTDKDSYLNSFKSSKPQYSRDKEGNVTGAVFVVYRLDKEGHQHPIASRLVRSKQGPAGKLESTYYWHPNIRKCFESNQ